MFAYAQISSLVDVRRDVDRLREATVSYIVIKTIGGRRYRYLQRSYRDGGKVRTKSVSLGPVEPRRRGLLRSIGDLIEANRAEPGAKAIDEAMEQGLRFMAAEEERAAQRRLEKLEELHTLYGLKLHDDRQAAQLSGRIGRA